jgi:hypothetical protein
VTLIKLQIVWGIGLFLQRQQLITVLGVNGEFASGISGKATGLPHIGRQSRNNPAVNFIA